VDELKLVRKSDLRRDLVRAAQARAGVSILAMPISLVVADAVLPKAAINSPFALLVFFGPSALICWLMTVFYCRPKVICPYCLHSLWDCGTGNFKPRRIDVRKDATECPNCNAPIR
jgi:hypothetical protein